jgi:hypothetical protein
LTNIKAAARASRKITGAGSRALSESCAQLAGFCEQALTVGLALIRSKAR